MVEVEQTYEELVAFVNSRLAVTNPTMSFLRGRILEYDDKSKTIKVRFTTHDQLSNGANQVQGGFSAAMLDASCAYLTMIQSKLQHVISTLEQKQTYLKSVPLNKDVICTATFLKKGREIAFYEAVMTHPETNEVYVKASQTALLTPIVRNKEKKQAKM